jgi:ribosomal-protein-alanine N-acetyltransferase
MTLLEGVRVRLKPLDESDIKDFYRWWNDSRSVGEFVNYTPLNWFEFEKFIKEAGSRPVRPISIFIIEKIGKDKESDNKSEKLGVIMYSPIDLSISTIEIGYGIDEVKERGKGLATEAVKLMVDFLFKTKNIERIEATTDTKNVASQKVLEKNGFKREGLMRKRSFVNGEFRDDYLYSILREEWNQPKRHTESK